MRETKDDRGKEKVFVYYQGVQFFCYLPAAVSMRQLFPKIAWTDLIEGLNKQGHLYPVYFFAQE